MQGQNTHILLPGLGWILSLTSERVVVPNPRSVVSSGSSDFFLHIKKPVDPVHKHFELSV